MRSIIPKILIMLLLLPATMAVAQPRVSSAFAPPMVTVGEIAQFQISIEGQAEASRSLGGQLPKVDGLTISNTASTQQSVSIVNGQASRTLTYQFATRANREGTFTTPPFQINIDGQTVTVPSATLRVVPVGEEMRDAALVELTGLPDRTYAGQALPLRLTLWVRADIRLRNVSQPTITSEGFVIDSIDNNLATQTMQTRNGMRYATISWPVLATAVKPGESVVSYSVPIVIEDPTAQQPRRRSVFDFDPFGRESLKQINLANEEQATVLNLPTQGQPEGFSGAIGDFVVLTDVSAKTTRVGEPIELSLSISGEGNFSQINPPQIEDSNEWRSYPPTSEFQKTGQLGNEGVLNLDYLLTPRDAGSLAIPPVRFSYYDPERQEYVVYEIPPETVAVAQGERAPQIAGSTANTSEAQKEQRSQQERLRPIELLPSRTIGELKPIFLKPTFWATQAVPALALATLLGFRIRQRRLEAHPELQLMARHKAEARTELKKAREAVSKGDGAGFYRHARSSLQSGAAATLRREKAASIDAATVKEALETVGYENGDPQEIFAAFDGLRYGGGANNGSIGEHEEKVQAMVGALTGRKVR